MICDKTGKTSSVVFIFAQI